MGYLYASFDNGEQPTLLVLEKVTQGFHDINFKVPYPTLHKFKVGISTTVPKGYAIDRLDKEVRYKLRTNSMMVSQSTPMYESPGIGFAGLGAALQDHTKNPAKGGQDSANNPYWDGDWNNFSWANGFTGDADISHAHESKSPQVFGSYHGYYARRMSYAVARFDLDDKFLGWDIVEKENYSLPAGVPMCVIMQFFVLPEKTDDGGNVKGAADREMLKPYWKHAHDYDIPPAGFHLLSTDWRLCRSVKNPADHTNRYDINAKGAVKDVERQYVTDTRYNGGGYRINDTMVDAKDIAAKLEWYNESSGQWSAPSTAPQFIPTTNEDGFTKVIFRVPRQLDPVADKDMLQELEPFGVDYRYETTKQYFPYPLGKVGTNGKKDLRDVTGIAYNIMGRPAESGSSVEYQEEGITYFGRRKIDFDIVFAFGDHPYAGVAGNERGGPKPGTVDSHLTPIYFADPEKMARMNHPELLNAFYPVGGFKLGGMIIAIGRGMALKASYVMSKSATVNPTSVYPNRDPTPDGSKIGTEISARLRPKGIILTTDLEDDRVADTEEKVLAAWKAKFGTALTASFFSQYSFKDQDVDKPTHYKVKDPDSGLWITAPYQIIYFEVGPEYTGPYVDYEIVEETETDSDGAQVKVTKLKITQPADKPYALGKNDPLWLHCRTPYGKTTKQAIDIIDEVEEQRVLMDDLGMSAEETLVYNELDNPPQESTAAVAEIQQEEQRLLTLAVQSGEYDEEKKIKLPRGAKYIRSGDFWKLNPYYARESELKSAGLLGGFKKALSGFTDSRDFYVEDVTQKWGAAGSAGLGGTFVDTADENLDQIVSDAGYLARAAVNTVGATAGAVYNVLNGDMDKAEDKFDYIVDELTDQRPDYGDDDDVLEIAADLVWNVAAYGTSSAAESVTDLVDDITGLGGYSANGLGDGWAKAADIGEGVGKFVRGTARGLAPDALTEGIDDGLGTLTDKFKERPMLYTGLALAAAPLLIPGIGGAYARNVTALAGGAIGLVPKGFKALTGGVSAAASGTIDGVKEVGNSIVGKPNARGTAASRRRSNRR